MVKGKKIETEEIPAFCAVALAGLGEVPDTILSRSIVIPMRRRASDEKVEPFRRRLVKKEAVALRERTAAWAALVVDTLRDAFPVMPSEIVDRQADIWEPLFAIAEAAGPTWFEKVRVSAIALVTVARGKAQSLGVLLLKHLKAVFGEADRMWTDDILKALLAMEEAPWSDIRGKPLDARSLPVC